MKNQECSVKSSNYMEKFQLLLDMKRYYEEKMYHKLNRAFYNTFTLIPQQDKDRQHFSPLLQTINEKTKFSASKLKLTDQQSRAIGCFLGLAICDALGASTEFEAFQKDRRDLIENDFEDIKFQIMNRKLSSRSGQVDVWTDDCSMALSMGDSLLLNEFSFNPKHTRHMFNMWLWHGLGNGGRSCSIGLGGNISISMNEFVENQEDYTKEGQKFNNGNGSLMRLAPIPICFSHNLEEAMKYGFLQSKTTHNGDEAAQCSRLLSAIIVNLINRKNDKAWKEVIEETCDKFETEIQSVKCLALSKQESAELFEKSKKEFNQFAFFNQNLADRNWNWKDPNFNYSPGRLDKNPGYIGSYCMDGFAMALHTVWTGKSFKQIALVNANMGGDCDTVGAIAGQISGAIYGVTEQMLKLYSQMKDFKSQRFQVFLQAYKLFHKNKILLLAQKQ